jgi:hypothetical protein
MAYMIGRGHQHTGPGTSMVQFVPPVAKFRGMGACGSCETRMSLGACCADCAKGSNCSGSCRGGLMGMGLFEAGMDFSQWGAVEWVIVALGGYVALSTVFTTQRASRRVKRSFKRYARRRAAE